MNAPIPRPQFERWTALAAEKRRRRAKADHCVRGYRDENGVWQGGLLSFVRYFWHILEPGTPLITGWAMESVCEHLEAVTFGEITRLLINVPPGFCKALSHDTPILTTWGWKNHGNLAVNDFVFGPDGRPKRIIACSEEMIKDAYEVEFDDGAVIVAGEDHLWAIERDVMSAAPRWKRGRKSAVVKTTDLRATGVKRGQVNLRPDRIAVAGAVQFPPKRLPIDPYVLGAWLGDGTSNAGNISTSHEDVEHFVKLGRIGTVYPPSHGRKQIFYRLVIDGLHASLKQNNLLKNKHIPLDYLEASVDQRWALLQGLMDTDGHCAKNGACSFSNKNSRLIAEVKQLACSLGLKVTVTSHEAKFGGKSYGLHHIVCFTPPVGTQVFRLDRKQKRVRGNLNGRSRNRFVEDVRMVGKLPMKCVQVEGGLYLAGRNFVTTHNSLLTDVFWPAWEWGPMELGHLRYVAFSYSSSLTERDNGKFATLLESEEYRAMYGQQFRLVKTGEKKVSNSKHGWKLATSVGGVGTGERGDRIILDDPHNVKESESETVRQETIRWFRESMSSRLNNMETGAKVVIMQRVNEEDVSGTITRELGDYCHLMIQMEFSWDQSTDPESGEPYATDLGWVDPRWKPEREDCEGELAWPERFPDGIIPQMRRDAGPHAWAAQYQQIPAPRGGGIFKTEWWQPGELFMKDGKFPPLSYVVASLDGAYTEDEENDPSALTVWGIFLNENGYNRAMLLHAWRKRLAFSGPKMDILPGEHETVYRRRCMPHWGLIEWVADTCKRFQADRLLIEAKATGISTAQSLRNSHGREGWAIELVEPKGDKYARGLAVQPSFSQEMIYAPDRDWADLVIEEMAVFPKGKHDDLTDSATQAVKHLRDSGLLRSDEERRAEDVANVKRTMGAPKPPRYPGFGSRRVA